MNATEEGYTMTTIKKVQKFRLNSEQSYRVRLLLNEVCETVSPPDTPRDKRIAAYKPGWSDENVAEHFKTVEDEPFECSPKNVKYIRVNAFGSLYLRGQAPKEKKAASGGLLGALTRIGMLRTEFKQLREEVDQLKARVSELEDAATKPDDIKTGAYSYKLGSNGSL